MSLRLRLTLLVAGAVAVAVAAVSVATFLFARRELRSEIDEFLLARAAIVELVPQAGLREVPRPFRLGFNFPIAGLIGTDSIVQVVDLGGQLVLALRGAPPLPIDEVDLQVVEESLAPFLRDVVVQGQEHRMVSAAIPNFGLLQIARSLAETNAILADLRNALLLIGGIGVALSALVGWLVAGRALVPVGQLTGAAEHVAETRDLSSPIDVEGNDELARLARSFNTMLEALAASQRQQQQLVVDAGHELRTPITSLRTNLEVLARTEGMDPEERERLLNDVRVELDELTLLVGELVQLATDVAPTEALIPGLRLDDLVAESVDQAKRRTGREITLDAEPTAVEGRPGMLDRAVRNLLDNADKWSPDGSPIEVAVRDGRVTVRDHGPGIRDEDRPYVFERFYRSAEARSTPGSGLGLAIVSQVVDKHGGRAWVEPAPDGGTIAGFELPTTSIEH
ncbi:MAG: ATP-binding protein [Acidimicrobiia bacterium]